MVHLLLFFFSRLISNFAGLLEAPILLIFLFL